MKGLLASSLALFTPGQGLSPWTRISYCHLEPVSFYEFLDASGNELLKSALIAAGQALKLNPRLHQRALELFSEYCLVGGLPEVVSDWIAKRDDVRRLQLQRDLICGISKPWSGPTRVALRNSPLILY